MLKLIAPLSLCLAFGFFQPSARAQQTTNKSASVAKTGKEASPKKQTAGPFRGKLASLDKTAKTITVGKRTFHVSSDTKISSHGKTATLPDGVVGDEVSGYFKTADDGNLVATRVTFGPKPNSKSAEKKTQK